MQNPNPAIFPQGPAATVLVPHDPLKSHTISSIPPTFLLAILCIVIGIPSYLVYQGAFKTTEDSLENKIRKEDDSYSAAAGEKKEKKRDVDDPAPPLDLRDLTGLGGLVGLAALIVMAFALFPEELNTMLGGLKPSMEMFSSSPHVEQSVPGLPPIPPDYATAPGYQSPSPPGYESYPSDREYLADEGILPSWAEDLPEEQWYDRKSAKEIMLTCRIKPWLCDEEGLPVVKRTKPRRRIPHQTQVIREKEVEAISVTGAIVTESAAVASGASIVTRETFLEQHMAVLRSQPILMLPYDEESVIDLTRLVIFMLLISPLPIFYAFEELLFNAGLVDDKATREDKKLGLEKKAEKEFISNENRAAIAKAKSRRYKDEVKKLEAADDLQHGWRDEFLKRPWWAGSNWKPDEEMVEKSKRLWRKERQTGTNHDFEDENIDKPRRRDVNARAFKLDYDAEMEDLKAQRHEAENAKILAKYPKDQTAKDEHPFRGLVNGLFEKSQNSGQERTKKKMGEAEVETRVTLNNNIEEARDKYRRMDKARKKGKAENKKRNQPKIDALQDYWKREGEIEQKEREESRWTPNRYKDPDPKSEYRNGFTKIERLTARQRQIKEELEPKWEKEESDEEELVTKTYKLSPAAARKRFEGQVPMLEFDKVEHWLKRLRKKRDRTEHDEVYKEVLEKHWKEQKGRMEAMKAPQQQKAAAPGAGQGAGAGAGAAPAKPQGTFQKMLGRVGKA